MDWQTLSVVRIFWVDPTSIDEWGSLKDAVAYQPHTITTIGYLIGVTEQCYVTASNVDLDSEDVSCCMVIPKTALVKPIEVIIEPKATVSP